MKTKTCSHKDHEGRRELPLSQFSRHPRTKDGLQSICKACNKRLVLKRTRRESLRRKRARGKDPKADYREDKGELDYREDPAELDYVDEVSATIPVADMFKE